jgi:cytochrome c551
MVLLLAAACSAGNTPDQTPTAEQSQQEPTQTLEEAEEIDAAALYSANCAGCHGEDRSGRSGPALLPSRLTRDPDDYAELITNGGGGMPAFGSRLSADEIDALVEFILTEPQ